uniref:Uncharacterized protein n=1 Tax=Lates calcarifer TaxID=8187 RepID=A0A4W6DXL5_LATCA
YFHYKPSPVQIKTQHLTPTNLSSYYELHPQTVWAGETTFKGSDRTLTSYTTHIKFSSASFLEEGGGRNEDSIIVDAAGKYFPASSKKVNKCCKTRTIIFQCSTM